MILVWYFSTSHAPSKVIIRKCLLNLWSTWHKYIRLTKRTSIHIFLIHLIHFYLINVTSQLNKAFSDIFDSFVFHTCCITLIISYLLWQFLWEMLPRSYRNLFSYLILSGYLASNLNICNFCQYRQFRQNRHFHQNRHLPRGHIFYPIWIASLNFWQIFPLSSKSPLSKGRVFQIRNFCQFSHFRKNRQFRHFRHYRQNRHSPRDFFWHPIWVASPLAIFRHLRHPNVPFLPISPKSPLFKGPHLASIFAIACISGHNCVYE